MFVYILENTHDNRTYVGATIDPDKRLKQHNGILKGGAKYTKSFGKSTWIHAVIISGLPNWINTLQCEWRLKHPTGSRRSKSSGIISRIKALNTILHLDKWTNNSTINISEMNLTVKIKEKYVYLLENLPSNVELSILEN